MLSTYYIYCHLAKLTKDVDSLPLTMIKHYNWV